VFPAPGAIGVCADAALSLSFDVPVFLGSSGVIRVIGEGDPDFVADEVDLGASGYADRIGGRQFHVPNPVVVEGRFAHVRLHSGALRPGVTYAVTIDAGVFTDAQGHSLGALEDTSAWWFTTRAPAPASPAELVVAADGSGDFCSVQAAFDAIPEGGERPVVVAVRRGTYREIVFVENKSHITLRGEDRSDTVIAYTNNENLQYKRGSKVRALVGFENVSDLVIENLTLKNTTQQGGSQAEALRIDPGERVVVRNANLVSRQDTLLLTGRVFVSNATIEGNVDYVWGKGTAYFDHVEMRTVGRAGWNVQARNPADRFGYVFVDSTLSADPDVTGHLLARIDAVRFPASHVAYVGCRFSPAVAKVGWEITPPGTTHTADIRFWEADSKDLDGKPLDTRERHSASKRLTRAEAEKMRDPKYVLGGWDPQAP
jgi:hypothetical protein